MQRVIIGIDPSGDHKENNGKGFGTTGIAVLIDGNPHILTEICAEDYDTQLEYWKSVIDMIAYFAKMDNTHIVCESYKLHHFAGRSASMQAGSDMPTCQLIGVIRWESKKRGWSLSFQQPSDIKTRWSEDILVRQGYLVKKGIHYLFDEVATNQHKRDALKHTLHYNMKEKMTNEKEKEVKSRKA